MLASLRDLVVYLLLALAAWVESLSKREPAGETYTVTLGEDFYGDGEDVAEAIARAMHPQWINN